MTAIAHTLLEKVKEVRFVPERRHENFDEGTRKALDYWVKTVRSSWSEIHGMWLYGALGFITGLVLVTLMAVCIGAVTSSRGGPLTEYDTLEWFKHMNKVKQKMIKVDKI